MEKTDLKKILSIAGEHGLFRYIAQGRNGMIAESMVNGQRKMFGPQAKVSALADISIYTTDKEVSLREVLEAMAAKLSQGPAPDPKGDPKAVRSFFDEVIPDYDEDRFYVSHMKKILLWYEDLREHASLEFEEDEPEEEEAEEKPEEPAADQAE